MGEPCLPSRGCEVVMNWLLWRTHRGSARFIKQYPPYSLIFGLAPVKRSTCLLSTQ